MRPQHIKALLSTVTVVFLFSFSTRLIAEDRINPATSMTDEQVVRVGVQKYLKGKTNTEVLGHGVTSDGFRIFCVQVKDLNSKKKASYLLQATDVAVVTVPVSKKLDNTWEARKQAYCKVR